MIFNPDPISLLRRYKYYFIFRCGCPTRWISQTFRFCLRQKDELYESLDGKIEKSNQGTGIIRWLYKYLPRKIFLQIPMDPTLF